MALGRPEDEAMALDPDLIKVLAADSRRDILRRLAQRRMTLTELAASLDLKKATVLEHLKRLTDADLVRRIEDDRLWVYYELTPRGTRVVSPGRTRFYLLFGVTLAALGAAALLVLALSAPDAPDPGPSFDARGAPLAVALDGGPLAPGEPFRLVAESVGEPRAYLLDPDAAAQLRSGGRLVQGIPLAASSPRDDAPSGGASAPTAATAPPPSMTTVEADAEPTPRTLALSTPAGLAPGTYYVYVVDALGRTNADELAVLVVEGPRVRVEPAVAWLGLTEQVLFRAESVAPDATLQLVRDDAPILNVTLEAGTALLDAPTLDGLAPGTYRVREGGRTLAATLDVRDPQPSLLTPVLVEGSRAALQVATSSPLAAPVPVLVDGEPVAGVVPELAAGVHDVRLGRLVSTTLEVVQGLSLDGGSSGNVTTITLANATGAPVVGASIAVDDLLVGATDADGRVTLHRLDDGRHVVRLQVEGEDARVVPVDVREGALRPAELVATVEATPVEAGVRLETRLEGAPDGARVAFYAFVDEAPRSAALRTVNATGLSEASFELTNVEPGARRVAVEVILANGVLVGDGIHATAPPAAPSAESRVVQVPPAAPDAFDTTLAGRVLVPTPGAAHAPTAGAMEPAAVPASGALLAAAALIAAAGMAARQRRR